jgi:hypothetical protein
MPEHVSCQEFMTRHRIRGARDMVRTGECSTIEYYQYVSRQLANYRGRVVDVNRHLWVPNLGPVTKQLVMVWEREAPALPDGFACNDWDGLA